jgi:hypothetical protein
MRWSLQDPRLRRGLRISKPSHVSSNAPIGPLIAKLAPSAQTLSRWRRQRRFARWTTDQRIESFSRR